MCRLPASFYGRRWSGIALGWFLFFSACVVPAKAVILWSDLDARLAHETGPGQDILGGALKRDDTSVDTLYFKFRVNPISDATTEEYFAAFELYEGDVERLGVGNALKAWAYSAFVNTDESNQSKKIVDYIDLHSSKPSVPAGGGQAAYQFPERGVEATIVFKVQYVPDGDDLVTVWLNPDLGPGATEAFQPESLITKFNADASFDEIRLRHGGLGGGWTFSDMAIATAFTDFVDASSAMPGKAASQFANDTRSLSFHPWQREQGLPNNNIRALAQTREGYIWAGTDEGVARFNGVGFVSFGARGGLYGGPVRALLGDHLGSLWIGSESNGLVHWQHGQVTTYTKNAGLPSDMITTLAEDGEGELWIGTDAGLAVMQSGRLGAWTPDFKGKTIRALARDESGAMWVAVKDEGVFTLAGNKFVPVTEPSLNESLRDTRCLCGDHAGQIWVGTGDGYVLCREKNNWRRNRIPRHLAKFNINALAEEPDGSMWVGLAGGGLLRFKDGEFSPINAGSGLSGNSMQAFLLDQTGEFWVGSESGLNQMKRKNLFALGQGEGLGVGGTEGLAEVAPGVVWAGKSRDGLYRWDGRSFNRLTAAGMSPRHCEVETLLVTHNGGCWLSTRNGLLFYKDPRAVSDEARQVQTPDANIISLAEGTDELWAGTRGGKIWALRAGAWRELEIQGVTNAITALVVEADGSLWAGTGGGGLYRVNSGHVEHFGRKNGLPGDVVRALFLDAHKTLWIGTAEGGLARWSKGVFASFGANEGLPDNNISQILEDDAGQLWLGTSRGIACVSERELDDLVTGKISTIHPRLYGREDGMLSEECTGGFCPAGLKDKSGLLWFSTSKGLAVIDPHTEAAATPTRTVLLEEVLVNGISRPEFSSPIPKAITANESNGAVNEDILRIPPGKHGIEFHYTGLNFNSPQHLRFRYRLEKLDADWIDAGTSRTASYAYIPPGHFRFHVAASAGDGVWVEGGPGLALTVSRYFWQSWWFISSVGVGLLIAVGGSARFVEKRKLHRRLQHLEQQQALERERTRIAQDLHDEMGAKLCRISFLSEHARRGELKPSDLQEQITSISTASREVLHSLDEIVWAVNPQNDSLEHVASYIGQNAHEYFQMTGIECELDIPARFPAHPLSSQTRHHLFLSVHEALTNVLKHSQATKVKISMPCTNSVFEIVVADNGRGFNLATGNGKPDAQSDGSHDGLHNMQKRLADIGGECQIKSNSGQGTSIRFILPLNAPARKTPV